MPSFLFLSNEYELRSSRYVFENMTNDPITFSHTNFTCKVITNIKCFVKSIWGKACVRKPMLRWSWKSQITVKIELFICKCNYCNFYALGFQKLFLVKTDNNKTKLGLSSFSHLFEFLWSIDYIVAIVVITVTISLRNKAGKNNTVRRLD